MAFKVNYLKDQEDDMSVVVAEVRLYELADGTLVTDAELEDAGALFCGVGAELTGEAAKRYEAKVAVKTPAAPEEKSVAAPPEDKAVKKAANKGKR